jgi:hypothetical protein
MSSDCVFFPNISFDPDEIKKLAKKAILSPKPEHLKLRQFMISEHPYLVDMAKKYPFLDQNIFNMYIKPYRDFTSIHIDIRRRCALNIPVEHTEKSETIFYKPIEPLRLERLEVTGIDKVLSKVEEVYRFSLSRPTLINTSIPHTVETFSEEPRIIISWTAIGNVSFEVIRAKFEQ